VPPLGLAGRGARPVRRPQRADRDVRALHPAALSRATGKVITRLDKHCCAIIERATFVVIDLNAACAAA
jgi:hypothetical protein